MTELKESCREDLALFADWECLDEIRKYICSYSIERHKEEFEKDENIYLSININSNLGGFVLLKLEDDERSVEFRRIIIVERGKGMGQQVLDEIENYCLIKLKRNRIWLDVFDFNKRGIHIYEKHGYQKTGETHIEGKRAFIYEKLL